LMTDNLPDIYGNQELERVWTNCPQPKEYSCCVGHQFTDSEVIEHYLGRVICPICWPDGFGTRSNRLLKDKYDINYCINMLRQIQDHTAKYKFSTGADLALSLSHTLKKMIAHLEIERDSNSDAFP